MDSILDVVISGVDEEVIILDENYHIIEFSDNLNNFVYEEDISDKNVSDLRIGNILTKYINGDYDSENRYELSNVIIKVQNGKLIVHDNHKQKYYTISQKKYDENTVLFFKIIDTEKLKKKYINILSKDSDIIAEVISENEVDVLYTSKKGCTNDEKINLFNHIHSDDKEDLREKINKCYGKNKNINTKIRVKIDSDDWILYDISIRTNTEYPNFDNLIINGYNINDRYFFEQRRSVINRVLRHDLRNDMNVIRGYADSIKNDNTTDARTRKSAKKIIEKSNRLICLGDEVRKIDQEQNRLDRKLRVLNLNRMIREKIKEIHRDYPEVRFKIQSPENAYILGNSTVNIAIEQLVENAIVHNDKEEDKIKVSINIEHDKENGIIRLSIIDNGPGIEQGEKEVITSGVETPLDHISGLGLWMVKWVIDIIDGDLYIEENSNKGTKVTIEFYDDSHTSEDIDSDHQNVVSDLNKLKRLNDDTTEDIVKSTRG